MSKTMGKTMGKTIDHSTLSRLVATGSVNATNIVGQAGGWALSVKYGMVDSFLSAQRSGKLRLFRKLETAMLYLKGLGISNFAVDSSAFDAQKAKSLHKRPDRTKSLKQVHEAAEHDLWFRQQVQEALDAANKPDAVFIPNEVVMRELKAQLDKISSAGKAG